MRIVFISLYPSDTVARYLVSSYVLKAYVSQHGRDLPIESMTVANFSVETDVEAMVKQTADLTPDVVACSCYSWNVEKNLRGVSRMRQALPRATIIWGGPEVAVESIERYSERERADYYVIGEGERKFVALLRFLASGESGAAGTVPRGIAFWKNNALTYEKDETGILDLDEVPSIYLTETIEDRLYARQQAFVETQRGCRFRCKYCVYPKFLPNLTYHSFERVCEELSYLITQKQVNALRFCDAGFTSNLERAKSITRFLVTLKSTGAWSLKWIYWEYNFALVDEQFLSIAAQLRARTAIYNCATLEPLDRPQHYSDQIDGYTAINCIGIQSLNPESLKAVGRPRLGIDRLQAYLSQVRERNLVVKLDLILGLPFETQESYYAGLETILPFFRDTDHVLNIHRLEVLPGSLLENLCLEYNIVYSRTAPHLASSTAWIPEEAFNRCCRVTALLFRIINSPLRPMFFNHVRATGRTFIEAIGVLLSASDSCPDFVNTRLVTGTDVDDRYWNDGVFSDIPSAFLMEKMRPRS